VSNLDTILISQSQFDAPEKRKISFKQIIHIKPFEFGTKGRAYDQISALA
jgi:hypothetical protein